MRSLVSQCGGGNVYLQGWVDNVSDFYNGLSLYVQSSVTEGFGCEVLEAMAHGRPVVCSTGAGASDVVPPKWTYEATNVDALAEKIDSMKKLAEADLVDQQDCILLALLYRWYTIRNKYISLWKELVNG